MPRKKKKENHTPATRKALSLRAGEMTLRFEEVHSEINELRQEMRFEFSDVRKDIRSLQRGQEAILSIVTSIDDQLRELKTLPARVARLERSRR